MITSKELREYGINISQERLQSFICSHYDTINDVIERYINNIKISKALYPELSVLEVSLRNAINSVFENRFSKFWIENEIKDNKLLDEDDYKLLMTAYTKTKKECKSSSKEFTTGKVIANLNFGFWTNLCVKKYNSKIWNKKYFFRGVFINYPKKKQEISLISNKLYAIRKLRNRVFHYEQIFKYPEKILKLYNDILEILSYLPNDSICILKKTSEFLYVYNNLMNNYEYLYNKKT